MVIQKIVKGAKYLARQKADIVKYGEKLVERSGVNTELLNELTPFRRLSNKRCTLSDPKFFIRQFERVKGEKFLPFEWSRMSESEKVDYIVKDRYSRLVADKSMNKLHELSIKDEVGMGKERLIELDKDGNIISFKDSNVDYKVEAQNVGKTRTSIHNHPQVFEEEELAALSHPNIECGPSTGDMSTAIALNIDSYVIDAQKNKFLLEPAKTIVNTKYPNWTQAQARTYAHVQSQNPWLIDEIDRLKAKYIPLMNNSTNIVEFAKYKLQYVLECTRISDEHIQSCVEKGLCRYTKLN